MSAIRSKDTSPEMTVRKSLHAAGFRYRLHTASLPGKPDMVLPKHHAVVFVHGCFWHMHECSTFRWPKTRPEFWRQKLQTNRMRDERAIDLLIASHWRVAVVWECALRPTVRTAVSLRTLEEWIRGDASRLDLPEKRRES
jgi:DNA mismatch endonuclease (patch repair protein)